MPTHDKTIAIVGACGAVGREAISILSEREHPADRIKLYGSHRSAGARIRHGGYNLRIREFNPEQLDGCDVAILCATADLARESAPELVRHGITVIDNSSAFRLDTEIPLVIPEINRHEIGGSDGPRLIANPNCSTIMMLIAIEPIRRLCGIESITVSTYQAVSGAGLAAMKELKEETFRALRSAQLSPKIFPESCAFNVFPHESDRDARTGYCGEELKMIAESQKILRLPTLEILPTCVRVPVERCHAQSIVVATSSPSSPAELERAISDWEPMDLVTEELVTPRNSEGLDTVRVGRVRASRGYPSKKFSVWACCDQLRKGAALNAIQIVDVLE